MRCVCVNVHLDFKTFKELWAVICCSFWFCCGRSRIGIRDGVINNQVCIGTLVSVTSIVRVATPLYSLAVK